MNSYISPPSSGYQIDDTDFMSLNPFARGSIIKSSLFL